MDLCMVDRTLVVTLKGEIDHHTCVEIREVVEREYQKNRAKHLLFDFGEVNFMDSSGIGMLMGRYRSVAIAGGTIGLYNVSSEVEHILKISGIYKLMKSYKSQEDAMNAVTAFV